MQQVRQGESWDCLSRRGVGDQHPLQLRSLFTNLPLQGSKKDCPHGSIRGRNWSSITLPHSAQLGKLFSVLACFSALCLLSSVVLKPLVLQLQGAWPVPWALPALPRDVGWATPWLTNGLTGGDQRLPSAWAGRPWECPQGGLRDLFRHWKSFKSDASGNQSQVFKDTQIDAWCQVWV